MEPLKITIKVNKLDKTAFFKGKNGDVYCSLTVWPNKNGEDEYGNHGITKQDLGKDRRDEQPEIIGNARIIQRRNAPQPKPQEPPVRTKTIYEEMADEDSIPF
jgi:hypothetical protein